MSSASLATSRSLRSSPSTHSNATVVAVSERLTVPRIQPIASSIIPTPPIASNRSSSSRVRGARLDGPSAAAISR